ncbi:MAG TPA: Pr6Pr family membrane protein [Candidatus Limnocylindrales bacterium]|nr:Pr6Pr family membrane protein [Candidatus Limnocylindrales bacterium]
MGKGQVLTVIRLATIVVTLAAIGWAVSETASAGTFAPTRFFAYFTIQSNLIVVALYAWLVANGDRPRTRGLEKFRGAAASYMTVVFFVVIFLLPNVDVGLRLAWVDAVLHKVVPIVVVLDWLVDPPGVRLSARDALAWIAYPLLWAGLTLVRGAVDGWYPYPFLDPANGGYGMVALMVVAITVGFLVVAAFFIWVGSVRSRTQVAQPA